MRSQKYESLVRWYSDLISLRAKHKSFYDGTRTQIKASDKTVIADLIGDDVIVCVNPMYNADASVTLPELSSNGKHKNWKIALDSSSYFADWVAGDCAATCSDACGSGASDAAACSATCEARQAGANNPAGLDSAAEVLHIPSRTFVVLVRE